MPYTTEVVDAVREVFGDPVAIKARENGLALDWKRP